MHKKNIFSYPKKELGEKILSLGLKKYVAHQIEDWTYKKFVFSFSGMTNISQLARLLLEKHFFIKLPSLKQSFTSKDGTIKYAFKLDDGEIIETVLIEDAERKTICISSQVGCAYDCRFCVTGKIGFIRNLDCSEIVGQLVYLLKQGEHISNIVFMGMGEPLANFKEIINAIHIITNNSCLNFSPHRITISTCGIIPKIIELNLMNLKVNLAISLNAVDEKTRNFLMPINKKYPIHELISIFKKLKFSKREKITFEYILIKDINDSINDAYKLVKILKNINCRINLIVYNENPDIDFKSPSAESILQFQKILKDGRLNCFIRQSKGVDIQAACGQLGEKRL